MKQNTAKKVVQKKEYGTKAVSPSEQFCDISRSIYTVNLKFMRSAKHLESL